MLISHFYVSYIPYPYQFCFSFQLEMDYSLIGGLADCIGLNFGGSTLGLNAVKCLAKVAWEEHWDTL